MATLNQPLNFFVIHMQVVFVSAVISMSAHLFPLPLPFLPREDWISSDGDDRMGTKIKTQKNSLDQKLTPKTSHAEFSSLKNFQKALNDITRKIKKKNIRN